MWAAHFELLGLRIVCLSAGFLRPSSVPLHGKHTQTQTCTRTAMDAYTIPVQVAHRDVLGKEGAARLQRALVRVWRPDEGVQGMREGEVYAVTHLEPCRERGR
jgi:hypothetical protein